MLNLQLANISGGLLELTLLLNGFHFELVVFSYINFVHFVFGREVSRHWNEVVVEVAVHKVRILDLHHGVELRVVVSTGLLSTEQVAFRLVYQTDRQPVKLVVVLAWLSQFEVSFLLTGKYVVVLYVVLAVVQRRRSP